MFTGIIETVGEVIASEGTDEGRRITLAAPGITDDLPIGGSVAVDGACLTAVTVEAGRVEIEAVTETLRRTTLGELRPGRRVNLERAMPAGGRFDGHIVQGHVDGVGAVSVVIPEGDGVRMSVAAPDTVRRYLVEKGSITVDGVSLTVAALAADGFEVALIPHTLAVTTLGERQPGDRVNLEADILAKYVERLLRRPPPETDT